MDLGKDQDDSVTLTKPAEIFDLSGRVIIITGGASGIGNGIAKFCAGAGAHVVIADINGPAAEAKAAAIVEAGGAASSQQVDLGDEASVIAAVDAIGKAHGVPWGLVNCAGLQHRQPLLETEIAHWDQIHSINLRGSFLMLREVAKVMVAGGQGGRIVNVSSVGALHPQIMGLVAYQSSKAGVLGLTQNAAFELMPHGITVNTLLPGGVVTEGAMSAKGGMIAGPAMERGAPLGTNTPEDMGATVLFLISPAMGRMTNQRVTVEGGFLLS